MYLIGGIGSMLPLLTLFKLFESTKFYIVLLGFTIQAFSNAAEGVRNKVLVVVTPNDQLTLASGICQVFFSFGAIVGSCLGGILVDVFRQKEGLLEGFNGQNGTSIYRVELYKDPYWLSVACGTAFLALPATLLAFLLKKWY